MCAARDTAQIAHSTLEQQHASSMRAQQQLARAMNMPCHGHNAMDTSRILMSSSSARHHHPSVWQVQRHTQLALGALLGGATSAHWGLHLAHY